MDREEVIRMARAAGMGPGDLLPTNYNGMIACFERFASLVAAAERERCAQDVECMGAESIRALKD